MEDPWSNSAKVILRGEISPSPIFGASWSHKGQIVFANLRGGFWQVPAAGGTPAAVTKLQSDAGEVSHRLPQVLPDGETVLFTVTHSGFPSWDDTLVVAQSLTTGTRKVLIEGAADARFVSTGHLVYFHKGTLMAVPFDPRRLDVSGPAVGVVSDVMQAADIQPLQIDPGAGSSPSPTPVPSFTRPAACSHRIDGLSSGSIARAGRRPCASLPGRMRRHDSRQTAGVWRSTRRRAIGTCGPTRSSVGSRLVCRWRANRPAPSGRRTVRASPSRLRSGAKRGAYILLIDPGREIASGAFDHDERRGISQLLDS